VSRRFRFPLARLARVREIAEQQARAALAQAEREAQQALEALHAAEHELASGRELLRAMLSAPHVEPSRVLLAQGTLSGLNARVGARRTQWRARRVAADALALQWRQCRQDCQSLERLEERSLERFRAEEAVLDARGMDEIALQRMAARARGYRPEGISADRPTAS
jgi:flagellar export protein FliJ